MTVLTSLEVQKTPLSSAVDNLLEDIRAYHEVGSTKTSFGIETDGLLAKFSEEKKKKIKLFQEVFRLSLQKLKSNLDGHGKEIKACRKSFGSK